MTGHPITVGADEWAEQYVLWTAMPASPTRTWVLELLEYLR